MVLKISKAPIAIGIKEEWLKQLIIYIFFLGFSLKVFFCFRNAPEGGDSWL